MPDLRRSNIGYRPIGHRRVGPAENSSGRSGGRRQVAWGLRLSTLLTGTGHHDEAKTLNCLLRFARAWVVLGFIVCILVTDWPHQIFPQ
jgi:hypothetical protein